MDLVSPSSSWRRLPPATLDGARCDHAAHAERAPARHRAQLSMGVCLAGSCRALGCDLVIGSGRVVDRCGVCGGRGDSCPHRQHRWASPSLTGLDDDMQLQSVAMQCSMLMR